MEKSKELTQDIVRIKDKVFKIIITEEKILKAIDETALRINNDLEGKSPLFISVLNGSFIFAADLIKRIRIDCGISFIKMASYQGTSSTGEVKTLVGLDEDIRDRLVVILEDIVDTGNTIESLVKQLETYSPRKVMIATLLFKPSAYEKKIRIDYVALEVPDTFLVGYGLDYNGMGRNLVDIYSLIPG